MPGLRYDQGQGWRERAANTLALDCIDCYSPLRAKDFLQKEGALGVGGCSYSHNVLSTDRGINTRDHFDCMTSDLIFVNVIGAQTVSVGTVMEIAWAHAYRKPLVIAIENEGNCHDHPMTREVFGYRVTTLDEGIAVTRAILLP